MSDIYVATTMKNDGWADSKSAPIMLTGLYLQDPFQFETLIPILHRYFLACCWKIKFLIPQEGLRDGLRAAEQWIDGKISDTEFWRKEWIAEAEAFAFENVDTSEEIKAMKALVGSIDTLKDLSFELTLEILREAAYFTNSAMVYPSTNTVPFDEGLCTSRFLCADLLREFLQPDFLSGPRNKAWRIDTKTKDK